MSDPQGLSVWGGVAAAIGTAALIPLLVAWFINRLPSQRFPALLDLLEKTQNLFNEGIRDGLLPNENDVYQCHLSIWVLKIRIDDVCALINDDRSWPQDIRNWYNGLSGKICDLSDQLGTTRARLSRIQSGERKRLASLGYVFERAPIPASRERYVPWGSLPPPPPSPSVAPDMQHPPASNAPSASSTTQVSSTPTATPCFGPPFVPALADPAAIAPPSRPTGSPFQPVDSTRHNDTLVGNPALSPTHYIISDADFKSLLSVRLISPQSRSGGRRQCASRRTVLLQFGRKLLGPHIPSGRRTEVIVPTEKLVSSRTEATAGAMRHSAGAYSHGRTGTTYSSEDVDLEAQTRTLDCASDSDSSEWSDV